MIGLNVMEIESVIGSHFINHFSEISKYGRQFN